MRLNKILLRLTLLLANQRNAKRLGAILWRLERAHDLHHALAFLLNSEVVHECGQLFRHEFIIIEVSFTVELASGFVLTR